MRYTKWVRSILQLLDKKKNVCTACTRRFAPLAPASPTRTGTQFTCCAGTKVQILTPHAASQTAVRALVPVCVYVPSLRDKVLSLLALLVLTSTQVTCFTGTKVRILTLHAVCVYVPSLGDKFALTIRKELYCGEAHRVRLAV